jgi:sulfur-carrier protein
MEINFYAGFRQVVGGKTIQVDRAGNGTLMELLRSIVEQYPLMQQKLFDDEDNLRAYIRIFVNGSDFTFLANGLESVLQPGDQVDIFPPIGGGTI